MLWQGHSLWLETLLRVRLADQQVPGPTCQFFLNTGLKAGAIMPGFFPHVGPKDRTLVLMFTQKAQHSLKYLLVHLYESSFSPSLQRTSF